MTYRVDGLTVARPAEGNRNLDGWRAWSFDVHGRGSLESGDDIGFRGRVVRQASNDYQLMSWRSAPHVYTRTSRDIRTDERDHYTILVPIAGRVYLEGNEPRAVSPGEVLVVPPWTPFRIRHATQVRGMAFLAPSSRVEARLPHCPSAPRRPSLTDTGFGRVARDTLRSIHREHATLDERQFDVLADRALDMIALAAAAAGAEGTEGTEGTDATTATVMAVRRHVIEHIADRDLSLADVASAVGWSPRYVQLALARHDTTLRELLRQERLELARNRLAGKPGLPVAVVAASVGFRSPSAFSSAYRRHFGYAPTETRR